METTDFEGYLTSAIGVSNPAVSGVWIGWHLLLVGMILVLGLTGNATVLWVYSRNKHLKNNIYLLIFAVLDIFACVVFLPFFALPEVRGLASESTQKLDIVTVTFFLIGSFTANSYLFLLAVATTDKLFAVYYPFVYRQRSKGARKVAIIFGSLFSMLGALLNAIALYTNDKQLFRLSVTIYSSILTSLLVIILSFYALIIKRLRENQSKFRLELFLCARGHQTQMALPARSPPCPEMSSTSKYTLIRKWAHTLRSEHY